MIICTNCKGAGKFLIGGRYNEQEVPCRQCNGLGAVDGPQEERLIEAVNKVAEELKYLRIIAEREERREGH